MDFYITTVDSGYKINGVSINDRIFTEEKISYTIIDVEDFVDTLIGFIYESESKNDKILMKQDLEYLMGIDDEFVFSSIETNSYVAESDGVDKYNEICQIVLELNEVL